MRDFKRWMALLLVLAMAVAMVGCGNQTEGTEPTASTQASPQAGANRAYNVSVRTVGGMAMPGVQVYAGNFLENRGKGGIYYGKRSGVALETQHFPDSVNHPEWIQPFVRAGQVWESVTRYAFE